MVKCNQWVVPSAATSCSCGQLEGISLNWKATGLTQPTVQASWNVMPHVQKPDFVFRQNGRVHLNLPEGASVQSTTGSRGVRISGSNAGYTMFRGSVEGTGYPLHSPVSPSLPLPCVTVCHHISTGLHLLQIPWLLLLGWRVSQLHGWPTLTYECAYTRYPLSSKVSAWVELYFSSPYTFMP